MGVLRRTQENFTYTMAASIIMDEAHGWLLKVGWITG